jgi:hypothetical protein
VRGGFRSASGFAYSDSDSEFAHAPRARGRPRPTTHAVGGATAPPSATPLTSVAGSTR